MAGPLRFCRTPKIAWAVLSAALLGCGLGAVSLPAAAFQPPGPAQIPTVTVTDLPRQGQQTYQLILQGGPFPYSKDGTVFGNYERQLPSARRGYYHEYTVTTPGVRNRGARRIVCGGIQRTAPDACYYTSDHYSSFKKIVP
ncbi:MAG: ribonuclease [Burkholderiaceae bacterium]|nr:ribonuclease [Burkholderiaceae bacterium]